MGLTGVIVARDGPAAPHVETAYFVVDTDRIRDLDELLALLTDGSDDKYGVLGRLVRRHRRPARSSAGPCSPAAH